MLVLCESCNNHYEDKSQTETCDGPGPAKDPRKANHGYSSSALVDEHSSDTKRANRKGGVVTPIKRGIDAT